MIVVLLSNSKNWLHTVYIQFIKKMSMMVPNVKSELKESVQDGFNRYPDWPELTKVKKWLEF